MIYTIATLSCRDIDLTIDTKGNKYTVGLYNKESKQYTHNDFDNLNDAYKVFEKLSSWLIYGLYSEESKRDYLLTNTMR